MLSICCLYTCLPIYLPAHRYANTFKRRMWAKQQEHYRAKIAIDLSHYRLLERIVSSNRSAIILEDDARLTGRRWLRDMLRALQELPEVKSGSAQESLWAVCVCVCVCVCGGGGVEGRKHHRQQRERMHDSRHIMMYSQGRSFR